MRAPAPNSAVPGASALLRPKTARALVVDRNFGPWFWGNVASNSGSWLFNVVAAVVVFNLTGSALLVGMVSVAQFASLAVLSPWAGALSDRTDRRRLALIGQSVSAAAAAGIAVPSMLLGIERLPGAWSVIVAALGIGIGNAFAQPAGSSLLPGLVDDVDLEAAVSLYTLTFNVGRALGPAVAGLLLVTLGPELGFLLNALSFLALIGALIVIRERHGDSRPERDRSVRAGLRYVRGDRVTLLLLAGVATAGFSTDPVITLAPPLSEVLGGGDGLVAAMVSGFGVFATVAAGLSGWLQHRTGSLRMAGIGTALMAGGLLLGASLAVPWVVLTGFAISGGGSVLALTSFTSVLQRRVPGELRGRVMALWGVAYLGTRPLAAVIDGMAADLVGPRPAIFVAVAVSLVGAWVALVLARDHFEPRRVS